MITTKELLAAVRSAQGIPSNYKLAPFLGVTEHTVGSWNVGRNRPDEEMTIKLANLAGLDPAYVLASIAAERAKDDATRQVWASLAKRLQAVAATVTLAILANVFGVTVDGQALAKSTAYDDSAVSASSFDKKHRQHHARAHSVSSGLTTELLCSARTWV